jgi:quinohemoprotein ethanol dehydrogenase
MAYRADTGDKVLDLDLGTTQMGPPISFTIDGTQYIAVTGGQAGGAPAGRGGGAGAPAAAPRPANLLVLSLDGKAPVPGAAK